VRGVGGGGGGSCEEWVGWGGGGWGVILRNTNYCPPDMIEEVNYVEGYLFWWK